MAISTNGVMLTRLTGALYNQQLAAATYTEVLAGNSTAAALNAWANAAVAADFGTKTDLQVATTLVTNVGLSSVAGLANWVAAQLTAGGTANRGATIISLLNSYSNMDTTEAIYGASVATFNTKVDASQALSQTTGNAGGTYAAISTANTALTLTSATQTSTGTAGDDTFTAGAGAWGAGDVVNGGTGTDTLNATITGTGPTQSATSLVSIEVLNLKASPNPATLDLTGVTGLTQVNNASSANGATLAVTGLGNVVNTTITGGNTSTSIAYTTAVTAATALTDAATLTLSGTAVGTAFTTSGVETLTINSGTSANTLTSVSAVGMTRLNITGDQALTIVGTVGNSGTTTPTTTYDASAATGAVTLTQTGSGLGTLAAGVTVTGPTAATAGAFTVTTGTNNDTVTLGANANTVSTGAGNDTITAGGGANTITPGAGNDVVNGGAGVDTIRFDLAAAATNADTINNFSATDVMSFNLGSTSVGGVASTPVYGSLITTAGVTATASTIPTVGGLVAGTALAITTVAPNVGTAATIPSTATVVSLTGYTDGTAAGVITALGLTGTTGVATTAAGKFLLITYSVGNIAQVWSYGGDATGTGTLDTNIEAGELTLVATLNGVAANTLTAANLATYTNPAAVVGAVQSNTGQTINLTSALSTVNATSNAAGQYFTAGLDTVNVPVGMLPTGAFSSVQGLTLLDGTAGDADVLNASVLNASWDTGYVSTNIENINLNMLVADADGFAMTSVMPGTTAVNFTGTGKVGANTTTANMTAGITGVLSGTAFGLGSGYTGTVNVNAGALAAATLNLNGTTGTATTAATLAATSPTFNTAGLVTALTVNANANTNLNADSQTAGTGATTVFNATGTTVVGAGNVNILGLAAQFNGANINASGTTYTGALTLTPTDNGAIDLSTTTVVTGVRNVDLSYALGTTLTLATANNSAAYGTGAVNVNFTPAAAAVMAATAVTMTGTTATTDAVTFNLGSFTTSAGSLTTTNVETVTVNSSKLTALTIGNINAGAGVAGTQSVVVTAPATATGVLTLGTVSADSINTSGVTQAVTLTTANGNVAGTTFTGGAGATVITTSTSTLDFVTTGAGADVINVPATGGGTFIGGAGNDTYAFGTTSAVTTVSDSLGTDTLLFAGAGNISNVNVGSAATPLLAGIEQIVIASGSVLTVAPGQFAGQVQTINTIAAGGAVSLTLSAVGTLDASGVVATAIPVATGYVSATGVVTAGIALTGLTLTGSATVDTIKAAATVTNFIISAAGADVITLGSGVDTNRVDALAVDATTSGDVITGFTAGTGGDVINALDATYAWFQGASDGVVVLATGATMDAVIAAGANFTVGTISTNVITHTAATYLAGTSTLAEVEATIGTALGIAADASFANTDKMIIAVDDGVSTFILRVDSAANGAAIGAAELSILAILVGVADATTLVATNFTMA